MWQRRPDVGRFAAFVSGCRTCGLVFVNPPPTAEELGAYYAPESPYVEELRRRPRGLGPFGEAGGASRASARRDAKLELLFGRLAEGPDVLRPSPGARALDFGCGPGRLLDWLQAKGWQTYGLEPAVKTAFPRHREIVELPSEPTFQFVIVHHVLEHLLAPLEVLRALWRSMTDGAVLYVSVPRLDALPRHGDFDYCINARGHIVAYTGASLEALFALAAFEVLEARDDERLDASTGGKPRRLRRFGRKVGAPLPLSRRPLAPAVAALREHRRLTDPRTAWHAVVPVRLRAAGLQRAYRAELLAGEARRLRDRPSKG